VLQLPTAQVQMTVGEMWEDYLVWKEPQLQPTTFKSAFLGTYTNALNGMEWDVKTKTFNRVNENIGELPLSATIGDNQSPILLMRVSHIACRNFWHRSLGGGTPSHSLRHW
jgi:hypothetical protein